MTDVAAPTDHALKLAVTEELGWTPNVSADRVGIGVTAGVVTLSGQVTDYPAKQAAVSAALHVRGVAAVADEVIVDHAVAPRPDAAIARDAAGALAATVVVPAGSVHVAVRSQVITLSGAVGWDYQRRAAADCVASIRAVRAVVNDIVLSPADVLSAVDAGIGIAKAMARNAGLDASGVEVSIDGTKIRLTGEVESWEQRHQAEYAGWCTPGVTHVDNKLTILPPV